MPVLVVNRAMCIVSYGAECGKCVEACPTSAISLDGGLRVDATRCTLCGACQRVCPNEAVVVREVSAVRTRRCEALGGDLPCIAYVGEEVVEALGRGVYEFCSDCHKGVDVHVEAERVRGLGVEVRLVPSGVTGRRRLFRWVEVVETYRRGVPEKRRFSRQVHCKSIDASRCWFCEACFSACPTGALTGSVEGGFGVIRFDATRCTGCTLCLQVCPESAISKSSECRSELFRGRLRRCVSCGRPFVGDFPLCPRCRGVEDELRGLFA